MRPHKWFINCSERRLWQASIRLQYSNRRMVLKTLDLITSVSSSNVSNVSNFKPKCFLWWNLLNWAAIKTIGVCTTFLILRVKITPRTCFRSSRQAVFCKEGVLRNFAKFTGKHLCQSLFFDKVAGLHNSQVCKITKVSITL